MAQPFRWKDINTSFSGTAAAMAVAARSRENTMSRMDKFRDDAVTQRLAEEELGRKQGTGSMLIDQAEGREVDFSQPHDALAYYQDAQKFAQDERDYKMNSVKNNAMSNYYNNRTKNDNMTAREKNKSELMRSIFTAEARKKSGSGGSKKGSGKTTATETLLNAGKNWGYEPDDGYFGFGGMDEEGISEKGALIETLMPGDYTGQRIVANMISGPNNSGINTFDVMPKALIKEAVTNYYQQKHAVKAGDFMMQEKLKKEGLSLLENR